MSPPCGQAFFYFGDDRVGFAEKFVEIGLVAVPYDNNLDQGNEIIRETAA